jgi:hypothetical protein
VIAGGAVLVVAIVAATLLVVTTPGGTAQATPIAIASQMTASPSPLSSSSPEASPSPTAAGPATPVPTDWVASDLDGVLASKDLAHRLPIAIMIDDNIIARPQSGFSSASIVYQAPADGGEDRYMLVFQEGTAKDIGPVRSARPYYVYWVDEYKAVFGHYGGDVKSLQQVIPANTKNIYNMDALNGGSCPYHRIDTRVGPHNAYTNSADLISCTAKLGYPATFQNMPVRPFREDVALDQRPASQTITIPYRTGTIGYTFDPATDSYNRLVDGKLQIDPANKEQVKARNVIVMFQSLTTDPQSEPGYNRPVVANEGTGKAVVFQEGKAIEGTWKKTSDTALTRFYDSSGKEISLVRGQIYMQSVPVGTALTYK